MTQVLGMLVGVALLVAGCGGSGSGDQNNPDGTNRNTVTGPTNPSVVVNCLGDTTINTNVDCGPRNSNNRDNHETDGK